jgi:hypothetical protein
VPGPVRYYDHLRIWIFLSFLMGLSDWSMCSFSRLKSTLGIISWGALTIALSQEGAGGMSVEEGGISAWTFTVKQH